MFLPVWNPAVRRMHLCDAEKVTAQRHRLLPTEGMEVNCHRSLGPVLQSNMGLLFIQNGNFRLFIRNTAIFISEFLLQCYMTSTWSFF